MLKGEKVILRPMRQDDVARQHEFNQDIELYGLNCDFPRITSLEKTQADFETQTTKADENSVWFAIEADGMYIGNCCLLGLNSRHGNLELNLRFFGHKSQHYPSPLPRKGGFIFLPTKFGGGD